MTFFVLGFKDILREMQYENPTTEVELEINTHCIEDIHHWEWFLSDLERLGFSHKSWGEREADVFKQLWSDRSYVVRDLVYSTIAHVKHGGNAMVALAVIEYLEAAFGVFINCFKPIVKRSGVYDELQYFGRLHVEEEETHTRGAWIEGRRTDTSGSITTIQLKENELETISRVVKEISEKLFMVFQFWFEEKDVYTRTAGFDILNQASDSYRHTKVVSHS